MAILSGDVKLLKSAVMADVPEGGSAPTGNAIADGVSNAIFSDISEVARAGGQVSMRKVFAAVHTDDTDTYFGANVIVAEPPQDPRVSVTMFSTESVFDTRTQAAARVESYLNKGPEYSGFLYENHIAGQRVIQIFQRPAGDLPVVGQTLVLTWNEGLVSEKTQYVRATSVSSQIRLFYDIGSQTDYPAAVVTMEISDALRFDLTGTAANKSFTRATNGTLIRETTVADAGTYVGVVPLAVAANLGDFTINAESIFTQLVPSAQTETPISDVKTNGLSAALVQSGAEMTQTLTLAFTTTQALHVGGPIYPGSLTIERSGVTLNDNGGVLENVGSQVGTVDYDNGIVALSTNVFGTGSGSHVITFKPAGVPDAISDQAIIRVTAESRSLSQVITLANIPTPKSLSVAYLAQGRWYTLRDNGVGILRGTDSAFGVGTVNYVTGTVVLTLGALPDVGSAILFSSFTQTLIPSSPSPSNGALNFYVPLNSSGYVSDSAGSTAFKPGALSITWTNGGSKTATDNGTTGALGGDASGWVDYANGVIHLVPDNLPAAGTVFSVANEYVSKTTANGVSISNGSIGATDINQNSVKFYVSVDVTYTWVEKANFGIPAGSKTITRTFQVYDSGGNLILIDQFATKSTVPYTRSGHYEYVIGTINYATGVINITGYASNTIEERSDHSGPDLYGVLQNSTQTSKVNWRGVAVPASDTRTLAITSTTVNVSYSADVSVVDSFDVTVNSYFVDVPLKPNSILKGLRFKLGAKDYLQRDDNALITDVDPTTGDGTVVGTVTTATGRVELTTWPTSVGSNLSNVCNLVVPPTTGATSPYLASSVFFRTASVPLRPSSLSIAGTMSDGATFSVTADANGKIDGTYIKGTVDYEFGLVELQALTLTPNEYPQNNYEFLNIPGLTTAYPRLVMLNSLRYNAVAYSYLPLDADILGIDPVRLPSDGRVPIFRPGGFVVVGHTGEVTATVSNAQVIDCARVRLSRVRVIGDDGVVINAGYTADLEAGTVTFTDVSGYAQPVTIQHRIEDMVLVRGTQINGEISFTRPLTHDYPIGSYVSSALLASGSGDMFARVSLLFDQATWNGTFADAISGSAATGTFNSAQYPIVVTNRGARTERWVVQFTSSTAFNVIGENVGVIAVGTINSNCAPVNPATSVPYFTIPALGWGSGWSTGNVLRFNTVGAEFPVWVVRTVQQGPETVPNDSFTILIRGDVDAA